ncbi:hypothetical protein BSR28_00210 [Boudabousia liubingyangii]|uniref:ATP-dependent DNA helicase n=1 Tax=Boudabousia liubingyangii TaxID=1921764 RepID=UPI00093A4400|nr:ATP-dependent DNA helicase [Boudabousia liubingyangii]OKL48175.1 hypothetical protein BSR28_00210 [Boudabousia liubingyangii]
MSTPKYSAEQIARALNKEFLPTAEQARIIEAPQKPLLVVAGAGSGKTETMAARVLYLVANGLAQPEQILGLTFTKKAASELRQRIARNLAALSRAGLFQPKTDSGLLGNTVEISTYNSYAANLVKEYGYLLNLPPDAQLLGEAESWQIYYQIIANKTATEIPNLAKEKSLPTIISRAMSLNDDLANHGLSVDAAREGIKLMIEEQPEKPERLLAPILEALAQRLELLDIIAEHRAYKAKHHLVDFGDQVAHAHTLVTKYPELVAQQREQYSDVLLDEFQDTSVIQLSLLETLFKDHSVTAVGDPLQAIYGWRGASAGALDYFATNFGEHVGQLTLATSWRNDKVILEVANNTAADFRRAKSAATSIPLEPRPGAKAGQVLVQKTLDETQEAQGIAQWFAQQYNFENPLASPSMAILCRTRSNFQRMADACVAAGLPVAVSATGGLLAIPVIMDLVSALKCAQDASDDSHLLRLLDKWRWGAQDLQALSRLARKESKEYASHPVTMIDLLNELAQDPAAEKWAGAGLSAAAIARAVRLGQALREIRATVALPLPQRINQAIQSLGLDLEAQVSQSPATAEAALNQFRQTARDFAQSNPNVQLADFLNWLDTAEREERGLEVAGAESVPGAVNIMTVHAAKGLEWDLVAVPDLRETAFPSVSRYYNSSKDELYPAKESAWLTDPGSLPFEMRGDAKSLPEFIWPEEDTKDYLDQYKQEVGDYQVREERRLAYVAFTRARKQLLLSMAFHDGQRAGYAFESRFLSEALMMPASPVRPLQIPGLETQVERPAERPESDGRKRYSLWPPENEEAQSGRLVAASAITNLSAQDPQALETAFTQAFAAATPAEQSQLQALKENLEILLADFEQQQTQDEVRIPLGRVSATSVENLIADADAYARQIRRPVPQVRKPEATLGTYFHNWVERTLRSAEVLTELDEAAPTRPLTEKEMAQVESWKEVFTQLPLHQDYQVEELETDYLIKLGELSVPCRIDAVFRHRQTGQPLLVDWKTGRYPTKGEARQRYAVQLRLYQLAYAQRHGYEQEVPAQLVFFGSGGQVLHSDEFLAQDLAGIDLAAEVSRLLGQ